MTPAAGEPEVVAATSRPVALRRSVPLVGRRVVRLVVVLAALGVASDVLVNRSNELAGVGGYLSHIDVGLLAAAAAAEACSMGCYAALQRRLLAEGGSPLRLPPLFAISLAANAVTNSLPAGPVFGFVYSYRQIHRRHVPEVVAAWALVATNVMGSAALAMLAAFGVASAMGQSTAFDLVGVTAGTLVVAALAMIALRRPVWLLPVFRGLARLANRLVRRPAEPDRAVMDLHDRLAAVEPSWRGLAAAFGLSLGNWVCDLCCLLAAFGAVDARIPWRGLLLAYGAAQLAANLPITPGGLGVVEGSLTIGLVAYGGAEASSVAAVLVYRVISFWALLVVGWACIGGLAAVGRRRRRAGSAPDLQEVTA
ncbi:MAG TPA: YbhN family protein [Acidimicrobiales bacterium]|nr:YbhN family protein [Acidimicrobiales bacterium]